VALTKNKKMPPALAIRAQAAIDFVAIDFGYPSA
jgi:hypothetical protein